YYANRNFPSVGNQNLFEHKSTCSPYENVAASDSENIQIRVKLDEMVGCDRLWRSSAYREACHAVYQCFYSWSRVHGLRYRISGGFENGSQSNTVRYLS